MPNAGNGGGGYWRDKETNQGRGEEIDIVAADEKKKTICFAECKWQENADAKKIHVREE